MMGRGESHFYYFRSLPVDFGEVVRVSQGGQLDFSLGLIRSGVRSVRRIGLWSTTQLAFDWLRGRRSGQTSLNTDGEIRQLLHMISDAEPPRPEVEVCRSVDTGKIPMVSIVIPVFNQAVFTQECLNSVAQSTVEDHECVVVDDGNTSRRQQQMLASIKPGGEHQSLKILRFPKNSGLAAARNAGLRVASASWVLFLDSDDLLIKGSLDQLLKIGSNCGASVVFGKTIIWQPENGSLTLHDSGPERHLVQGVSSGLAEALLSTWEEGLSIPIHSALLRIGEIPHFQERLRSKEDFVFWFDFFSTAPLIAFAGLPSAIYRIHREQMTKGGVIKNGLFFLEALYDLGTRSQHDSAILKKKIRYARKFYGKETFDLWVSLSLDRARWVSSHDF